MSERRAAMTRNLKGANPGNPKWNFYFSGPVGVYRGTDVTNVIAVNVRQRRYVRLFWRIFRRQA